MFSKPRPVDHRPYYVVIQTAGAIWDGHADSADDAARQAFAAEWDPESMRYKADQTKAAYVYLHKDGDSIFQKEVFFTGYGYETDPRFDSIRKFSFNDLMEYRNTSAEAAALVDAYRAAIDAANKAELIRYFKSVTAK